MRNNRLFVLLRTFSQKEFKRFGEFLWSPYCNKNFSLPTFYHAIKRYYPDFNHKNFTYKKIYRRVLRKEKYVDSSMRNWLLFMYRAAEKFLSLENFEKNKPGQANLMLEELQSRELIVGTPSTRGPYFFAKTLV